MPVSANLLKRGLVAEETKKTGWIRNVGDISIVIVSLYHIKKGKPGMEALSTDEA
jgi:hypothetical protein